MCSALAWLLARGLLTYNNKIAFEALTRIGTILEYYVCFLFRMIFATWAALHYLQMLPWNTKKYCMALWHFNFFCRFYMVNTYYRLKKLLISVSLLRYFYYSSSFILLSLFLVIYKSAVFIISSRRSSISSCRSSSCRSRSRSCRRAW